jgi:NAD(P)H dehydrogenase (quinone)
VTAANGAGVSLIAYTSVLHADASPLGLAAEHRETEADLRAADLPWVLLPNGWYTENYTASAPAALAHRVQLGSARQGRISSAARADYAAAAAASPTSTEDQGGRVYELAGNSAFAMQDYAAVSPAEFGKTIPYRDLPEAEFKAVLIGAGLPETIASLLANSDTGASKDALFDDNRQLSRLIGRPTTSWQTSVAAVVKNCRSPQ